MKRIRSFRRDEYRALKLESTKANKVNMTLADLNDRLSLGIDRAKVERGAFSGLTSQQKSDISTFRRPDGNSNGGKT